MKTEFLLQVWNSSLNRYITVNSWRTDEWAIRTFNKAYYQGRTRRLVKVETKTTIIKSARLQKRHVIPKKRKEK